MEIKLQNYIVFKTYFNNFLPVDYFTFKQLLFDRRCIFIQRYAN